METIQDIRQFGLSTKFDGRLTFGLVIPNYVFDNQVLSKMTRTKKVMN